MTTTEMGGNANANTNNNSNNPNSSSSIASGTATGSDDEKSHTFRKRRLSLSRHNIAPESAALSAAPLEAQDDLTDPPVPEVTTGEKKRRKDESESDQKAHTFRKRRLSVTLKAPASLLEDEEEEEDDDDNEKKEADLPSEADTGKDKPQQEANNDTSASDREESNTPTRPRRASEASEASLASSTQAAQDALKVRTLHAGEIVNQLHRSPPSPAVDPTAAAAAAVHHNSNNEPHVLYRLSRPPSSATLLHVPFAAEEESHAASAPKWKKRITRKHDEDERKLPFPRDVVGTYSCHGVEPVYDSDYENNMGEDEEGEGQDEEDLLHGPGPETWTEDISGDACTNNQQSRRLMPTPNTGKPTHLTAAAAQKEPKPTTAAKINQDRGGVAFPYGNCPRTALFAAYDGHGQGGELVSQFALHEVQSRLEKRPEFNTDLEKAFKDTFLAVDESLQHEPLIEPLYAGTTACVALLRDNVLTVANAGDSRAVVARRNVVNDTATANNDTTTTPTYQAIDLTVDQNPDLPAERQRIESMGGFVSPPPEPGLSARVWLDEGFSQIGLAMARSIGDHAVARVGVIAEPVVTTHTVMPDDEFLIIATDGVWEFLSSETAVEIVGANLARGATKATQALIEAAAARWHDEEGDYRDDITALVIRLPELWKQGRL